MARPVQIAPSILAADFGNLAADIQRVEKSGADMLHLDIMDGHFVPNISFGPPVVESIRPLSTLHFDTHLMLTNPEKYIDAFAKAGSNGITIHLEAHPEPDELLRRIGDLGLVRGLSLNPDMPVERLKGRVANVDRLLVMSVFPGFGGQSFIQDSLARITAIRAILDAAGRKEAEIQVDGGVSAANAKAIVAAGANILVAGTAIFRAPDARFAMDAMR